MKVVLTVDEVRKMLRYAVENSMPEGTTTDRVSGSVRFVQKFADGSGETDIAYMIDCVEVDLA